MINLKDKITTDTWIKATWEEYIQLVENPEYEKAKCYYFNGELRIEMSAVGNEHSLEQEMINLQTKIPTDTWEKATWEEYIQIVENPEYEKARCYYFNGEFRIEMSAVGNDHSLDHAIVLVGVNLFAILKSIPLNARDNCTYRKTGVQECQPDVSYYIGEKAEAVGRGKSIINLDNYPAPDLVIEIASTSLLDDLGKKRLLYEDLNVKEYWIVDVENIRIIAFAIADGGSRRITSSGVLPGLQMSVLEEALQLTRTQDQSQVGAWLMAQFQS